MNNYNERWTRDKYIEFRKMRKDGVSIEKMIEYFGDCIFESGYVRKVENGNYNYLPRIPIQNFKG